MFAKFNLLSTLASPSFEFTAHGNEVSTIAPLASSKSVPTCCLKHAYCCEAKSTCCRNYLHALSGSRLARNFHNDRAGFTFLR